MKHLILGGAGQLAQSFHRILGKQALVLDRLAADLQRPEELKRSLASASPAVILNCAAYNQVDKAESDAPNAWAVNSLGPAYLADFCRETNALLVHFSTNYVFGVEADRRRPYTESDLPGPQSVYGVSKLAGEHLVLARCPRALVIRTCGLFGHRAPGVPSSNFVATMLRVAKQGKPLRVVDDQVCTPTFTDDLAQATLNLIRAGAAGLFHVTNSGECSWFEFARGIFRQANLPVDLTPVSSREHLVPAPRPAYSVLSCKKYEGLGFSPLRIWDEAVGEYLGREQI